jgi:uncharacterized protein
VTIGALRPLCVNAAVGNAGWNPELIGKRQTIVDLNWNNDFKEIFLDGDSKIVLIL